MWRFPEPKVTLGVVGLAMAGGIRKAPLIPDEAAANALLDAALAAYTLHGNALKAAVERAIGGVVDEATLARIVAAFDTHSVANVMSAVDFTTLGAALQAELSVPMQAALLAGGALALETIPGAVELGFEVLDPFVEEYLRTHVADLVREVTLSSQQAVSTMTLDAYRTGKGSLSAAKDIRGAIGLTQNQATAVVNYRAGLIEVAEGRMTRAQLTARFSLSRDTLRGDVTLARVDQLTGLYRQRWIVHRSQVIGRTESVRAVSAGRMAFFDQAFKSGALNESTDRIVWSVTPDDRLCPICAPMDGQERKRGESFTDGNGASVAFPPAHVSCRCDTQIKRGRKPKGTRRTRQRVRQLQRELDVEPIA